MTKKKSELMTERARADRLHAMKLLRAERERSDSQTGELVRPFTQVEIGQIIGLQKNTVNDIEQQALAKVREGLARELGVETFDVTDEAIAKFMRREMARDRQKQIHHQRKGDEAHQSLPYKMLQDDLVRMHRSEGTPATLQALNEHLLEGGLDQRAEQVIREFIKRLEAE